MIATLFEIFLVILVFCGAFHEDKLIKLEKKIKERLRSRRS
jgi:hypothetical protein